jgi:hypothetical protein
MLGSKNEFVLHVKGKHDYRYLTKDSDHRNQIIETLKKLFADKFHQNLPIFAVEESRGLKKFTTCTKLAGKGISLIPPNQFRVFSENLIKDEA